MCRMVKHAVRYNGALTQVMRVLGGNEEECNREERWLVHANRGYCHATIISCLPMEDETKAKKHAAKMHRWE